MGQIAGTEATFRLTPSHLPNSSLPNHQPHPPTTTLTHHPPPPTPPHTPHQTSQGCLGSCVCISLIGGWGRRRCHLRLLLAAAPLGFVHPSSPIHHLCPRAQRTHMSPLPKASRTPFVTMGDFIHSHEVLRRQDEVCGGGPQECVNMAVFGMCYKYGYV